MKALSLSLEHYRNLAPLHLEFSPESNVICGKNGQGKTNLLESLWLFTGGHSFRGARDGEVIAFGEPFAKLSLTFFSEDREQVITLTLQNGRRSFALNGVEKKTGAEMVGKFCAVIFSPEHLSLVKGGPGLRRSFLDGVLCQSRPAYAKEYVLYQRTLQQRNSLLKEVARRPELAGTLEVWNQFLAVRGVRVIRQRQEMTALLAGPAAAVYRGLSRGQEQLEIAYSCTVGKEEEVTPDVFLQRLAAAEKSDILTGCTTVGPHRDDLEIRIDGRPARLYGSQGQQRSAVLALKLAEAAALEQSTGEQPVILLDDVMSELDGERRDYLLNRVENRQIFLTCCDPAAVGGLEKGKLFSVCGGEVSAGGETTAHRKAEG